METLATQARRALAMLKRDFRVNSMCAADVAVNVGASFSCFMRLRIDLGRPGSSMGLTRKHD